MRKQSVADKRHKERQGKEFKGAGQRALKDIKSVEARELKLINKRQLKDATEAKKAKKKRKSIAGRDVPSGNSSMIWKFCSNSKDDDAALVLLDLFCGI